jgi:hypothetical protein
VGAVMKTLVCGAEEYALLRGAVRRLGLELGHSKRIRQS